MADCDDCLVDAEAERQDAEAEMLARPGVREAVRALLVEITRPRPDPKIVKIRQDALIRAAGLGLAAVGNGLSRMVTRQVSEMRAVVKGNREKITIAPITKARLEERRKVKSGT